MLFAFFDASALAKRYVSEPGTPEVNHLFGRVPADRMIVLNVGLAEVVSLLVRHRNTGKLTPALYHQGVVDFNTEVVLSSVDKVLTDLPLVSASFSLIGTHSINATDAIV